MIASEATAVVGLVASYWPAKMPIETQQAWAHALQAETFTLADATAGLQELAVLRKYRPSLAEIVYEADSQRRVRASRTLALEGDSEHQTAAELFPHVKPGFA